MRASPCNAPTAHPSAAKITSHERVITAAMLNAAAAMSAWPPEKSPAVTAAEKTRVNLRMGGNLVFEQRDGRGYYVW